MLLRLVCLVFVLMVTSAATQARDVKVFAAASLSDAMADVATAFAKQTRHRIKVVLAGSSTLARQIEAGADADIFLSADEAWMAYLAERKLVEPTSYRRLLTNSLVLVTPKTQAIKLEIGADGRWLAKLGAGRIAMGDPVHVPVGKYAMSSLKAIGMWSAVRKRLATALDTRAALALVERGEAVAGIVYATDARASTGIAIAGRIPSPTGHSIAYPIALTAIASGEAARLAYAFICGPKAGQIFRRHGFGLQ